MLPSIEEEKDSPETSFVALSDDESTGMNSQVNSQQTASARFTDVVNASNQEEESKGP